MCVFEQIKTALSSVSFINTSKFKTGRRLLMTCPKYERKDVKKILKKLKISFMVKAFPYAAQKATSCCGRWLEAFSVHNIDRFCFAALKDLITVCLIVVYVISEDCLVVAAAVWVVGVT